MNQEYQQTIALFIISLVPIAIGIFFLSKFGYTEPKEKINLPVAAYNVSGEYAMIKAASQNGWLDEKKATLEMLTSIKRAGADIIISYFAKDIQKLLKVYQD